MLVTAMEVIISDLIFCNCCWARHSDGQEVIQKEEYQAHLQFSMDERLDEHLSGTSKYVDERLQDE